MFVYDFFRTYCAWRNTPITETIEVPDLVVTVTVTKTDFLCDRCDLLEKYFVPCTCDAGHPILFALRPFPKVCSCGSWLTLETSIQKTLATILLSDGVRRERQARTSSEVVS